MIPVTLLCVDCVDPETAVRAIRTGDSLPFARRLLLSDTCPGNLGNNIEWRQIHKIESILDYNLFKARELWLHVETPHVLTVEADGFILRPQAWKNEWLSFDYIGAPWSRRKPWASKSQVGNGGFSLRSQTLLAITSKLFREKYKSCLGIPANWCEDHFCCRDVFDNLVAQGIKFASPEIASEFSFEDPCDNLINSHLRAFGFHGRSEATSLLCDQLANAKLRLIVNYYNDPHIPRAMEIAECLRINCGDNLFDEVISLSPSKTYIQRYGRLRLAPLEERATFADIIEWADLLTGPSDVNVIANSDIEFDPATIAILRRITPKEFWCLSRWENQDTPPPLGYYGSQDVWAWRGRCRLDCQQSEFKLGYPACDNKIALLAHQTGYVVRNPSLSIRIIHIHDPSFRRYPASDAWCKCPDRYPPPYLYVDPHKIDEWIGVRIDKAGPDLPDKISGQIVNYDAGEVPLDDSSTTELSLSPLRTEALPDGLSLVRVNQHVMVDPQQIDVLASRCNGKTSTADHKRLQQFISRNTGVEDGEYDWLSATADDELLKLSQLIIEFHSPFSDPHWRSLTRLSNIFALVHVHGCGDNGLELTYINKHLYTVQK